MSSRSVQLKHLHERRDRLRAEMEALKVRLDEVEGLIRLFSREAAPPQEAAPRRPKRGDLKANVLAVYEDAGEAGLASTEAVSAIKSKLGIETQPGSVSSLLSRLKADGVLIYDGERYRLRRFAGPRSVA